MEKDREIIPIELKSSATGHLKSLFYYAREKKLRRLSSYLKTPIMWKRPNIKLMVILFNLI